MSPHSPFPACLRSSAAAASENHYPLGRPPSSPPTSGNSNLTTCLYQTNLGIFSLTWSRTFLGHSLHLLLHHSIDDDDNNNGSPLSLSNALSLPTISFHLHIRPFLFWKRRGSKDLINEDTTNTTSSRIQIFWDLSRVKFGSGQEPQSGFYVAVVVDREMVLLVGDLTKEACAKTKALKPEGTQVLIMRKEHVFGNRVYATKARFGGKNREISIDCRVNSDARLCFCIDNKRVLQIKRLKWKFRGNERIEVDGVPILVSWDVYNWLFEDINNSYALFVFKFETPAIEGEDEVEGGKEREEDNEVCGSQQHMAEKNRVVVPWQQNSCNFGMNEMERRKMRKRLMMRTVRSSSSSSMISVSSASSGCSSSVMEWASVEESELSSPNGFSLLVYAWRK